MNPADSKVLFYKYLRLISCLFLLQSQTVSAQSFPEPVISFQHAWFSNAQTDNPPPAKAVWRIVNLPDNWYVSHLSESWPAWYRMDFMIGEVKDSWGIYLPVVNTNAVIWLNGKRIGDGGRIQDPVARNWHRPLYFNSIKHLLIKGQNSLYIQLIPKRSGYGFLGNIHIGPETILQPAYEYRYLIKQTLIAISAVILISFGLFISLIWFKRRKDSMYGWFAASCFFWAFVALDMCIQHVPVSEHLWDTLVFSSVGWLVISIIIFLHRFWDERNQKYEHFLLWFGFVGTMTLYLIGDKYFYFVSSFIWDNLLITFSLYMAWFIIKHSMTNPSIEAWILVIATIIAISFGGHDNLVQMGVLDFDRPHLMPFGGILLLGVFLWMLIKQFINTLNEMEKLNLELDIRVQTKSQELVKKHTIIKHTEQEMALSKERERIMRDMHDGTGGYLVSALAQVETGKINKDVLSETLQNALDDIRLMIDSLDPVDEDIVAVLAMFRSRIEPRLNHSGLKIQWKIQDVPPIPGLRSKNILHLMHILNETVTNIIKHAQADTVIFRTGTHSITERDKCVFIEIEDNGKGYSENQQNGRGITNMDYRATKIHAKIKRFNSEHGAVVRISF